MSTQILSLRDSREAPDAVCWQAHAYRNSETQSIIQTSLLLYTSLLATAPSHRRLPTSSRPTTDILMAVVQSMPRTDYIAALITVLCRPAASLFTKVCHAFTHSPSFCYDVIKAIGSYPVDISCIVISYFPPSCWCVPYGPYLRPEEPQS
jgi:hypothetical protein